MITAAEAKTLKGSFVRACFPVTTMVESAALKRAIRSRTMLDGLVAVRITDRLIEKGTSADPEQRTVTRYVSVSNPGHIRRVTGFGKMADALAALTPGSVVELYGPSMGGNGFRVDVIETIYAAPVTEAKPSEIQDGDQHEAEASDEVGTAA